MNNEQTLDKMKQMRLMAMAQLHSQQTKDHDRNQLTHDEYLSLLVEHEWADRQNKKIQRLVKQANFRQKASVAEVSFDASRNLDKNAFHRVATLNFIKKQENLICTGASGVGKSYLAQALGMQACLSEYKVFYSNTARLLNRLKLAKVDGTYIKETKKLNRVNLLILDDFGLQALDNYTRDILLDIIDERFNTSSTIVASQIPVSAWYEIIGEATIADAILDRLVNSSHRIDLKGESLRKGILKNE